MSTPAPETATPVTPAAEDSTVAILSYITPLGFIAAIVMHGNKKTALGSFHLRQALGLYLTGLVIWLPCIIISMIPFLNLLMFVIGPVVMISMFVLWIMGLMAAINGQQKLIPVVGEQYAKMFANAFI